MNVVMIQGRLVREPEMKKIPSGTSVTEVTVAVDDGWGDNKKTVFVRTTIWDKTAEMVAKNFKKGDAIIIEGKLSQQTWEDKNGGGKREKTGVTATRVHFPMSKPSGKTQTAGAATTTIADTMSNEDIPF